MVAPDVLSEIDTLRVEVKVVPLAGLNVGVAATVCRVYEAEPTALCVNPLAVAIAFTVVAAVIVIGPE
jgi:predicted anti-sigma-YlaC factor YlaD